MMKRKLYGLGFILAVIWVFQGIAMSAPTRPTTVAEIALYRGADRQQILEEGAKKEGKLTFYTVNLQVNTILRPIIDTFEKKYPFIKVEIWRAAGSKLNQRIIEEYKIGKYSFDVMESTVTDFIVTRAFGILQPFYSPNLAFLRQGVFLEAPSGGVLQAAVSLAYSGLLAYNTDLVTKKDVPKTYKEVLDPKWKGSKFALPGSGTGLRWMSSVYETYGLDMVKRIAAQEPAVHLVSARAVLDMVIGREYGFALAMTRSHTFPSKEKGAPIDWVFMDPCPINVQQVALPKYPAHPYAAMLLIDHYLSKESAEIYKSVGGYFPPRKDYDVSPPEADPPVKNMHFGPQNIEQYKEQEKIFRELFLKGQKLPEE